jgi:hypothetical protein
MQMLCGLAFSILGLPIFPPSDFFSTIAGEQTPLIFRAVSNCRGVPRGRAISFSAVRNGLSKSLEPLQTYEKTDPVSNHNHYCLKRIRPGYGVP